MRFNIHCIASKYLCLEKILRSFTWSWPSVCVGALVNEYAHNGKISYKCDIFRLACMDVEWGRGRSFVIDEKMYDLMISGWFILYEMYFQ